MNQDIKNVYGYRDDMVCPIVLTTAVQLAEGSGFKYFHICIDAIFIKKIDIDGRGSIIYTNKLYTESELKVVEPKDSILRIIGFAFVESDKRKLAEKVLEYGIGL